MNQANQFSIRVPFFFIGMPMVFPQIFSSEECVKIQESMREIASIRGPVMYEGESKRACAVRYINMSDLPVWLASRLGRLVLAATQNYGFKCDDDFETFQYCSYAVDDLVDWHVDMGYESTESRKLTLSIQLSDSAEYIGGDLEFLPGGLIPFSKLVGSVVVFPAFLAHRITRVTLGERVSLVTWVHGPRFC
jgi:PKHD-type hydroxylase